MSLDSVHEDRRPLSGRQVSKPAKEDQSRRLGPCLREIEILGDEYSSLGDGAKPNRLVGSAY